MRSDKEGRHRFPNVCSSARSDEVFLSTDGASSSRRVSSDHSLTSNNERIADSFLRRCFLSTNPLPDAATLRAESSNGHFFPGLKKELLSEARCRVLRQYG